MTDLVLDGRWEASHDRYARTRLAAHRDDATELSLTATERLLDGTPDDKRAAHQALIVAGALLASQSEPRARSEHAGRLMFRLTGPTGSAPLPGKLQRAGDLTPAQREAILMTTKVRAEAWG